MSDFLDIARGAAVKAGALIRSRLGEEHVVERKGMFDFVTQTDRLSETLIRDYISQHVPGHSFFCEEQVSGGLMGEDTLLNNTGEYTWIVDALDGTTNFIRQIPQFAVSIALARRGELIVGAVYDPSRDELFSAQKGSGATLNGRPIQVSQARTLDASILSVGFPAADMKIREETMVFVNRFASALGSLRVYNCASLLLCYLAAGRTDLSMEMGLHLWDMAAGVLLVREAGGIISGVDGLPFDLHARSYLAGNKTLHGLVSEINGA